MAETNVQPESDPAQQSDEPFTLRSEFARRTSHFKSVSDSNDASTEVIGRAQESNAEEVADIEETLRVIDSARRFLHDKSRGDSAVEVGSHFTSQQLLARDMSKETLKHMQSLGLDSNTNDVTQEVFREDLQTLTNLQTTQGEFYKLKVNGSSHLSHIQKEKAFSSVQDNQLHNRVEDTAASHRESTTEDPNLKSFIKIEQQIAAQHSQCSAEPLKTGQGAPLRSLKPVLPHSSLERNLADQVYAVASSAPKTGTHREADEHLFGEGTNPSMSPRALDADYAQLKASIGEHNIQTDDQAEKSRLYETGEQSDAIKSVSRAACLSIKSGEANAVIRASVEDESQDPVPSAQLTTQGQTPLAQSQIGMLNRSHTAQDVLNTTHSLTLAYSQPSLLLRDRPTQSIAETSQPNRHGASQEAMEVIRTRSSEKVADDEGTISSDFKHKISLKYEKIELEHKLADMMNAIQGFKNAYGTTSSSNSLTKSHGQRGRSQVSSYSQALSNADKSDSPPQRQAEPRAGRPRALKVLQKNKNSQSRTGPESKYREASSSHEHTMDNNSEDEHTFRPQHGARESRNVNSMMPLQVNRKVNAILSSHATLVRDKTFSELRNMRREKELREVTQQRDQVPYQEYVKDLEEETRQEIRRSRADQAKSREQHAHFSQPPPSRQHRSPSRDSVAPMPQAPPKLITVAQESGNFDGRYFAAMSIEDSGTLKSGRTNQFSPRFDAEGNLISCLRSSRHAKNLNSARETNTLVSPRGHHMELMQQNSALERKRMNLRMSSYNMGERGQDQPLMSERQLRRNQNDFTEILSPSSRSNRHRRQDQETTANMMNLKNNLTDPAKFEHQLQLQMSQQRRNSRSRSNDRDQRRVRNINGFEIVQQIQDQMLQIQQQSQKQQTAQEHHHRSRAQQDLAQNSPKFNRMVQTSGASQATLQNMPNHNTQRSMGIESFCQKKHFEGRPRKGSVGAAEQLQPRKESEQAPPVYSQIAQIQQKSENLCMQLTQARKNRQEIEDNKTELVALKGENHKLRKACEQKDLALVSMREQNGEQKKKIEELRAQVSHLEKEVETVGDQQLFRKYKELITAKDDIAGRLAAAEFTAEQKQKSHDLMQQSYETLRQSQLDLVEMNKKLIVSHQTETEKLQKEVAELEETLESKTGKLQRYSEIIKTFDAQIEMFEEFEAKTIKEMSTLQSQLTLYQGLFFKEKQEKEELVTRMRPSQRPLHSSVKKQMDQMSNQDSAREWHHKIHAFDSHKDSLPMGSLGEHHEQQAQAVEKRKSSQEQCRLTQTMSKNLSFGQPFHADSNLFGSGQSIKNRDQAISARRESRKYDLPLQILAENSSEEVLQKVEQEVRAIRHRNQDFPPLPRKQDSSMGRPVEQDTSAYMTHFENHEPRIDCVPYKTPQESHVRHSQHEHEQRWGSQPRVDEHSQNHNIVSQQHHDSTVNQSMPVADLDISGYSITQHYSRLDKPVNAVLSREDEQVGERSDSTHNMRRLSGCASAVINNRKLTFKKPRPASTHSHHTQPSSLPPRTDKTRYQDNTFNGGVPNQAPSLPKMKPMSPKDYYCRLKEMQRRLDVARNDITKNVSRSRSRSKSPVGPDPSQVAASNTYSQQLARQSSHQLVQSQQSQLNTTQFTNTSNRGDQTFTENVHSQISVSKAPSVPSRRSVSNSGKTQERKNLRGQKSAKGRPSFINSQRASAKGLQQHQTPTSLFYTSLYNGVQPVLK